MSYNANITHIIRFIVDFPYFEEGDILDKQLSTTHICIKVTIDNVIEYTDIDSPDFFSAFAENIELHPSFIASSFISEDESILGKRFVSYYSIEVPEKTKSLSIEFNSTWICQSKAKFEFNITK